MMNNLALLTVRCGVAALEWLIPKLDGVWYYLVNLQKRLEGYCERCDQQMLPPYKCKEHQ